MRVRHVNVGRARLVMHGGRPLSTGIFKAPVEGRVVVRTHGLEGDQQADLSVHGGPDKAVYVYPFAHYATWSRELGRDDFCPGQFGENLTVEGMDETTVSIGDVFRIGTAEFQVSQPRSPCVKLGIRMHSARFPSLFLKSGRVGFYVRVVCKGQLGAGDAITQVSRGEGRMTVAWISRLRHFEHADLDGASRAAGLAPLAADWRRPFQERIEAGSPDGTAR